MEEEKAEVEGNGSDVVVLKDRAGEVTGQGLKGTVKRGRQEEEARV